MEEKKAQNTKKSITSLEVKPQQNQNQTQTSRKQEQHQQPHQAAPPQKRKRDLPVHERPDFWLMILAGCLMSFQAGYINVIAMLKTNSTVSHITGTASRFGINLAFGDFTGLALAFGLLITFLAGGTLIGYFIRRQVFHFNRKYGIFLLLEAILLFFFKSALDADAPNSALLFGSFACGVQNALLTNLSGAVVRTTHVTGLMTDTGLVLGNYFRFKDQCKEVWRLKVLVPILITYILGAFFGAVFFSIFDYNAVSFAIFFIGVFGILIVIWRLLKRYKIDTFKELKVKLLGDSIDLKKIKKNNDVEQIEERNFFNYRRESNIVYHDDVMPMDFNANTARPSHNV